MALFHLSVTQTKRSAGQSAIASAAYRAGERLYSEYYGEYSDYTRKGGVICSDILLPSYQQIYTWVQKYKKDGEDALKDRRGRHKKDYKPQTEEERLKLEVTTLERQLYLSQMEIDVLKKLQELERGNR